MVKEKNGGWEEREEMKTSGWEAQNWDCQLHWARLCRVLVLTFKVNKFKH